MMKRLLCAWTANHVAYLRTAFEANDTVVSFDLDASAQLSLANIPYIEAHAFISMDEVSAFQAEADTLSRTWYTPIEHACLVDGVSPLEMERRSLYVFFHNALCARLIASRIFERFPSEKLVIFDYPREPIIYTDLHENATMPILHYLAEKRGMAVETVIAPQTEQTRIPTRPKRNRLRMVYNLLRNRWYWEKQFWRISRFRSSSTLVVLRINEGFRYAAIIDVLRSQLRKSVFIGLVGARSSAGLKLTDYTWDYPSFSLLPNHSYVLLKRLGQRWYLAWTRYQAAYKGDYAELFANSHFDFQFRHIFQVRLINTAQVFREARTIFKRLRTTQLMTSSILDLNLCGVIAAAQQSNLHITSIPDSGIPTEPNLTYFGDSVIAWTNDYREIWKDAVEAKNLHIVGMPPSIIARGYQQSAAPQAARQRRRVTLLMSTVQLSALSYVDIGTHRQALRLLAQVPDHLRDRVEVCFKLHPIYDFQHFYESLIPRGSNNVSIIRDQAIEAVLGESDLAVLVNINTSAHLLALSKAIPLLNIHTAASWLRTYDRLDAWGDWFTVTDEKHIWSTIERALFDPEYRGSLLRANHDYWRRLGAEQDDPAAGIGSILNSNRP